jgi:soluble lytic murein transglycosylase-like protein
MRQEWGGLCAAAALALAASDAAAAPSGDPEVEAAVAEASALTGVPGAWILQVMRRESAGDPRAVSPAGAMGLMQLMPATWAELSARLGLGADPFDVRDNVLAGAAYLRQMLDRFGMQGFLAAYNAGPARYAAFAAGRARLPRETRAYVARLGPEIGASAAASPRGDGPRSAVSLFARGAGLFPLDGGARR